MTVRRSTLLLLMSSLALLMTTGCTHPTGKTELRHAKTIGCDRKNTQSPPDFRVTALILRDHANGESTVIDFRKGYPGGVPITPNLPFRTNHDMMFHVYQEEVVNGDNRVHNYNVLLGPDPTYDLYAEGEMRASVGRFRLGIGWGHFDGDLPVGETELVGTSARGTEMALRIRPHEDPKLVEHYVYNLEHTGTSVVRIWQAIHGPDDPDDNDLVITIDPGKYVVITETGPWPPVPQDVNWDDPLIRHMQKVARLAETKAKACKSN